MTPGREECRITTIAVSSGSGSGLINRIWAVCPVWRCVPPTEASAYDITVKDSSGHMILKRVDQVGTIAEECHLSLGIAHSVEISNATVDGSYKAIFDMH